MKISIVTPSFNQADCLEDTIISVLSQNYPNLEYVIIDGGSTDGSVDIIKKYADRLTYWVSEPDKGRGDAINKGFKQTSGEIMAWLGCGDMYCPWAFKLVNEIFNALPEVEWLTSGRSMGWNAEGMPYACGFKKGHSRRAFFEGRYLSSRSAIHQESTFWKRSLWERAGGYVNEKFSFVPDFELWFRFWQYAELYTLPVPLAGIRYQSEHGNKDWFQKGGKIGRGLLKKYNKNSSFLMFCNDLRYLVSLLPILKYCVASKSFTIIYDNKLEKWMPKIIYV